MFILLHTSDLRLGKILIGIGVVVKHTQFTKSKSYPGNSRQLLFWEEKKNTRFMPLTFVIEDTLSVTLYFPSVTFSSSLEDWLSTYGSFIAITTLFGWLFTCIGT